MLDLVGNPEDRFSPKAALLIINVKLTVTVRIGSVDPSNTLTHSPVSILLSRSVLEIKHKIWEHKSLDQPQTTVTYCD